MANRGVFWCLCLGVLFVATTMAIPRRLEDSTTVDCFEVTCPAGTIGCSRQLETSEDTSTITTEIKCEDSHGQVLHQVTASRENPYPGVQVTGYSFRGTTIQVSSGESSRNFDFESPQWRTRTSRPREPDTNDLDNQVETFET